MNKSTVKFLRKIRKAKATSFILSHKNLHFDVLSTVLATVVTTVLVEVYEPFANSSLCFFNQLSLYASIFHFHLVYAFDEPVGHY